MPMHVPILFWIAFNAVVLLMLVLDLGILHRKIHEVGFKEAITWTGVLVALALAFNVVIYFWHGRQTALEFLTGYVIEYSLSVDNIFVFLLIFSYFKVPAILQHRVLFWGIVGALIMRALFIGMGITLIRELHWVVYLFGAFLVATGVKLAFEKDKEVHPERGPLVRLFRRLLPFTGEYEGSRFFVRRKGRVMATMLFMVLVVVESTDIVFAVDSIPAVLAITTNPFIVYTSNIFAILGLRALYFAVAGFMRLFHHLHYGLSVVLAFVGIKMLIGHFYEISTGVSLLVIVVTLGTSVAASLLWPRKEGAA